MPFEDYLVQFFMELAKSHQPWEFLLTDFVEETQIFPDGTKRVVYVDRHLKPKKKSIISKLKSLFHK